MLKKAVGLFSEDSDKVANEIGGAEDGTDKLAIPVLGLGND